MKFGGHETFPLRDNWLFKGMQLLKMHGDLFANHRQAIALLGVGKNMVKSIKHWLLATDFAQSINNKLSPTVIGSLVTKYDPYYDRLGSVWIIHYLLACNKEYATTWYWFFNKFAVNEFIYESALQHLQNFLQTIDKKVSLTTLTRDLNVLLRMYTEFDFHKNNTPENNDICPLTRISLVKKSNDIFQVDNKEYLPIEVFGYALVRFWQQWFSGLPQFSFEELLVRDFSPTRVFCLTVDKTVEMLDKLAEKFPKQFSCHHTAGVFVVELNHTANAEALLQMYYRKRR